MKCVEVEKQIDLMLDDELNLLQKQSFEQHLEQCKSCLINYQILQKTRATLRNQPNPSPSALLDKRILQAFENHHQSQKISFWKHFLIPKPAFAVILALFAIGCGLAFLIGRMSVSQTQLVNIETLPVQSEPKIERIIEPSEPKIVTVTKYVKVPVIKEKEIVKIVQIEKQNLKIQKLSKAKEDLSDFPVKTNALMTKIDLEQFQPTSDLNVRIIKKGDPNE